MAKATVGGLSPASKGDVKCSMMHQPIVLMDALKEQKVGTNI
jgi:hypothetical protein